MAIRVWCDVCAIEITSNHKGSRVYIPLDSQVGIEHKILCPKCKSIEVEVEKRINAEYPVWYTTRAAEIRDELSGK